MVHVNRQEASRYSETWGTEEQTREEAVRHMLTNGSFSYADSGTLLRIAIALERLVELFNPVKRKEEAESRREDEEYKKKNKEAAETAKPIVAELWKSCEDWVSRNRAKLDLLPGQGYVIHSAIRREINQYERYPHYNTPDYARILLTLDLPEILDKKLYNIGPHRIKEFRQALQSQSPNGQSEEKQESSS